jgi:hypothetical protein
MVKQFSDSEIEGILKNYKRLKLKVTAEEEQLYGLYPSCVGCGNDGQPHAMGSISRQTENFGIKNAVMKEYLVSSVASVAKQVRIIELIYDALDADCRDLIMTCYMERNGRAKTLEILHITNDVFGRRRRQAFSEIENMLVGINQKPLDFAV